MDIYQTTVGRFGFSSTATSRMEDVQAYLLRRFSCFACQHLKFLFGPIILLQSMQRKRQSYVHFSTWCSAQEVRIKRKSHKPEKPWIGVMGQVLFMVIVILPASLDLLSHSILVHDHKRA